MSGINRATIIGRLGQDPEVKSTNGGKNVCNFSVATSETWTDNDGNRREDTEWHDVTAWGKLGELCAQYLRKGRQVCVEGKIKTRTWESDGVKHYRTGITALDVTFLGDKANAGDGGGYGGGQQQRQPQAQTGGYGGGGYGSQTAPSPQPVQPVLPDGPAGGGVKFFDDDDVPF